MDNVVSINHTKTNTIEFDLTMDGVETKDIVVTLVVEAKDMKLGFEAKKKEKDTWDVKIPKLPMLERTAYDFHIMVHADGYHFEPLKGTFNVVGSAEVYSSEPKNVTIPNTEKKKAAPKKKKAAPKKKVTESWRGKEKSIEQLARELTEKQKTEKPSAPKKAEDWAHNVSIINEEIKERKTTKKSTTVEEKVEPEVITTEDKNDGKVRAILEEVGIVPQKAKKKPRLSVFNKH